MPTSSAYPLPPVIQIVDQHILAQIVWAGEECAATVDRRHLVDEVLEVRIVPEHEDVDQ